MTTASGEQRWLDAFRRGDPAAMEALFVLYADRVYRLAYRLVGSESDAEEILSEAFLRAFRSADELRDTGAFQTWLFRVARNLAYDRLRQPLLLSLESEGAHRSWDPREALATRLMVKQALGSLPPDYREALHLADVEQMPGREAAEVMELSLPAFKAKLHRARRALREQLMPDEAPERGNGP